MGASESTQKTKRGQRGLMRTMEGLVVRAATPKTVLVETTWQVRHPVYGKFMRKTATCFAHDEKGVAKLGDRVRLVESRPISRTKRWRVQSVVTAAK